MQFVSSVVPSMYIPTYTGIYRQLWLMDVPEQESQLSGFYCYIQVYIKGVYYMGVDLKQIFQSFQGSHMLPHDLGVHVSLRLHLVFEEYFLVVISSANAS